MLPAQQPPRHTARSARAMGREVNAPTDDVEPPYPLWARIATWVLLTGFAFIVVSGVVWVVTAILTHLP